MPLEDSLFRFSLLLLFVPVLVGAGFGVLLTWTGIRRRARLASWPSIEVEVLSSEVERTEYRSWYFTKAVSWDFIIDFQYGFQGRSFRSQVRLEADVPGASGNPDQQVLDNAVAQARRRLLEHLVTVRVNPDDPAETAWLDEGPSPAWLRLAGFSAVVLVSLFVLTTIFSS